MLFFSQFFKFIMNLLNILVILLLSIGHCLSREMTVHVNAKERECFYERVPENYIVDFEYQVIDGGHGDLDINFEITTNGRALVIDYKKSDNVHRLEQNHPEAEYKFCFDNTISHFNRKTVFFELLIEDPENPAAEDDNMSEFDGFTPEEFYELKVQDIQDSIHKVRLHLTKARQFQDMLRSYEARDRNLAELNCSRVSLFSIIIVITMISVGLLQVFMIKNLFETNPKSRKVWDKLGNLIGQ